MDIDAGLARLGEIFDASDAAAAERMLREHADTVPDCPAAMATAPEEALDDRNCLRRKPSTSVGG